MGPKFRIRNANRAGTTQGEITVDELDALSAEALKFEPLPDVSSDGASIAPAATPVDPASLIFVTRPAVITVGGLLCQLTGTIPLDDSEKADLAFALARLLSVYDMGNLNPQTASLLAFGMTALGCVTRRLPPLIEQGPESDAAPTSAAA
jgi:hypothetical protein